MRGSPTAGKKWILFGSEGGENTGLDEPAIEDCGLSSCFLGPTSFVLGPPRSV